MTLMVIPTCLVVAFTIALVTYLLKARSVAQQSGGALRWQGMMTTILTATIYCISFFPYAVYRMAESIVTDPKHFLHKHYFKIAISFVSLNTISNFYVYGLTVPSFREFVKQQMHQSCRSIISITSVVGEIQD